MRRVGLSAGFTLIEMMVSMGVGMVVLLLGVAALKSTSDSYEHSTGSVGAEREARAVLTQAAEDLSKAVRSYDLKIAGREGDWRQDTLGFLCLQPADAQSPKGRIGDLCGVVYYIKDLKIGRATVRCLMRGFRDSTETFDAVRNSEVMKLYEQQVQDEPVAFGVISFQVDPLRRGEDGKWEAWEEEEDPFGGWPEALRLRLVVAKRELVAKLRDAQAWDRHPLIGRPQDAENSKLLEVYEIVQAYAHGR